MKRLQVIQLAVFAVVTVVCVVYGSVRFLDVGQVVHKPYEVEADFADAGGVYPRAEVELLGTRVGSVKEIRPGPDGGSIVVMRLDHDVRVPREVTAAIGNKSAIGEQYVELTPRRAGGPVLAAGDRIPRARTATPLPVEKLIGDLDSFVGSLPQKDLTVALDEMNKAAVGLGAPLGRLIDSSDRLTAASLAGSDSLIALIDDAQVVLDTQSDLAPQTRQFLHELSSLTGRLRGLDVDVASLFADGVRAGTETTNLLADNQQALPVLLNDLLALTTVVGDRLPAVRKTLVVFPWLLELGGTAIRHCEDLDAKAGKPVASSCDYDANGDPVIKSWLAQAFDQLPPNPPTHPCTRGYEGTRKFQPDGTPVDGKGHKEAPFEEPNTEAHCAASANDPATPNVRGAQNVPGYVPPGDGAAGRPAPGWAAYDGDSGLLVTPDATFRIVGPTGPPPPSGNPGLGWLLGQPLTD
ncbi:MAG TPA: MlaD family protein [Nocardioides sp.]|nr:MlaD family protein [Nocardioides sp.]